MEWVVEFFHFLENHWASIEIGVVFASLLALFKFNTSKCSLKIIDMLLHCDCTIFFIVHDKALMMMKITFYNNSLASHYNRKHNAFVVILKNHP